jgi:cytochrome d ubiquinol oxidase subunit I
MLKHQPAKMQAAEGFWDQSESPAPYYLAVVPDQSEQRNRAAIGVPYLGSLWLTHSLNGRVEGLKDTPKENQPSMAIVFWGFRVMYFTGLTMFATAAYSLWLRLRGRLFTTRWFLRFLVFMTPAGLLATLGGWYVAETGRQPWVIYGVLHTRDAVSPVPASVLLSSLIAFVVIYAVFMSAFLFFVVRAIRRGPLESPRQAGASGSLKNAFRPQVLDHVAMSSKVEPGGSK